MEPCALGCETTEGVPVYLRNVAEYRPHFRIWTWCPAHEETPRDLPKYTQANTGSFGKAATDDR
jgi:hypothetical protein